VYELHRSLPNVAVGWAKPGQSTAAPSEVIPGSVLAQYGTPPATLNTPTGLAAVTQSASSIKITWADNESSETGYKIERSTGGGSFSEVGSVGANVTTFTDSNLTASTTYTYRVRAYNATLFSAYSSTASATTSAGSVVTTYLSDLPFVGTPTNGWGPVERDKSVGEDQAGDGGPIMIKGVTYAKGLGVHSYSEITFNLNGQYKSFLSDIGLDDEKTGGSVTFQVWVDGVLKFDSGLMMAR